jgi:hypothetical protein
VATALAASDGHVLLSAPRAEAKASIAARSRSDVVPPLSATPAASAPGPSPSRIRSSSRRGAGPSVMPTGSHGPAGNPRHEVTASPSGSLPTGTVAITVFVAVSMTDIEPEPEFVTNT